MQEKEIKILWGRSGNRCAICKLELTPDGDKETLGEMAHIVAKSKDGPRGDSPLSLKDRDKYKNLILLCPTHHSHIDKNFHDWSVQKLHHIKSEHEAWVSEQLNTGNISVAKIDNADFLKSRFIDWCELSRDHISVVLSFTPLRISNDQIDTMEERTLEALEQARLPGKSPVQQVNRNHTRPSEFGIVNETFPDIPKRYGHSYHLFKSGHCEYFHEIGHDTDRITNFVKEKGDDIKGAEYVIRYTDLAAVIESGLTWIELLWKCVLPFEYLDFQCVILNTKNSTMFSYEDSWKVGVYGYPTRSDHLLFKEIVQKEHDAKQLELEVLKWAANCYGLVLEFKLDDRGDYQRPFKL